MKNIVVLKITYEGNQVDLIDNISRNKKIKFVELVCNGL